MREQLSTRILRELNARAQIRKDQQMQATSPLSRYSHSHLAELAGRIGATKYGTTNQ